MGAGCVALVVLGLGELRAQNDSTAPAPTPALTVDALTAEVLQKNPELDFYRGEVSKAKAGGKIAAQWNNPELSAELGSKRVWERGGGPTLGDGVAWSVSVAQPFEWPGRIALRKAIANRQVEWAELGLAQFQAALASRVRTLGYGVLAARQKADAAQEVAGRFRALLDVLVQRDPAGVTPLLDQRIIEANSITYQRRAAQAERELQTALLELNQLRGEPVTAPLKLTGQWPAFTNAPTLPRLLEAAATNNFDIRTRQVELAQQGFHVQLAKNERYPTVTLAPFYSTETANDEQRIVGVGLSLPLPLWNQNQGQVAAAEARVQQAEASIRLTCREVERKVADHALALKTRIEEMAGWRPDASQQLAEAAALADRHYRLGAVPVTTYLEMQSRYLEALDAVLATRSEALEHRQQLELLVGQPWDQLISR